MSEQLGHANPEPTLRTYVHALPVDIRPLRPTNEKKPDRVHDASASSHKERLERETGLEPATEPTS